MILLNGLFIALDIDTEVTFLVIYWVEILLKMYAFGWQTFIRSGWNRFDLIVMTAGVVVEIVSAVTNLGTGHLFFCVVFLKFSICQTLGGVTLSCVYEWLG